MGQEHDQEKTAKSVVWVPVGVSISVLISIVVVLGLYIYFLGASPVARNDPAAWGQFGDYIGGLLNPLFSLLNVFVFLYIAVTVQRLKDLEQRREQQLEEGVRTVLDLHREWNSESNYRARTLAGVLVRKYPSSTVIAIEKSTEPEKAVHLWIVIGFFLRLGYLAKEEKLQEKMAIDLFGELFVWWWTVSFEKQLIPVDWDASEQIKDFKEWLFARTTDERRAPWLRRARHDLEIAEANASQRTGEGIRRN